MLGPISSGLEENGRKGKMILTLAFSIVLCLAGLSLILMVPLRGIPIGLERWRFLGISLANLWVGFHKTLG